MNFEEWFLSEFGPYGFTLSMTMYNPENFLPFKIVVLPNGLRSRIKITPELSNDLQVWGMNYDHHVEALREIIRMEIRRCHSEFLPQKEMLKPVKTLDKFKFCP